jgi:hypothetical protein
VGLGFRVLGGLGFRVFKLSLLCTHSLCPDSVHNLADSPWYVDCIL